MPVPCDMFVPILLHIQPAHLINIFSCKSIRLLILSFISQHVGTVLEQLSNALGIGLRVRTGIEPQDGLVKACASTTAMHDQNTTLKAGQEDSSDFAARLTNGLLCSAQAHQSWIHAQLLTILPAGGLEDVFLISVLGDQAVHLDLFYLANTVAAGHGLQAIDRLSIPPQYHYGAKETVCPATPALSAPSSRPDSPTHLEVILRVPVTVIDDAGVSSSEGDALTTSPRGQEEHKAVVVLPCVDENGYLVVSTGGLRGHLRSLHLTTRLQGMAQVPQEV